MSFRVVVLLFFVFIRTQASDFAKLRSPWLEILPAGVDESKPANRGPLKIPFSNTPKGKKERATPNACSALELKSEMISAGIEPKNQARALQSFLDRCDKILQPFPENRLIAMIRVEEGNYPLNGRNDLREIVLHLPYDSKVHGLLAIKDTVRPRPMLIVICGVGCNLSDGAARYLLTQTFDTMPFNVLILPNLAASDFVRDNRGFGMGGLEEGRQAFEVVRLFGREDSPFRKLITSFHILGISLGGNGALFTSAYGSFNNDNLVGPKINSVIGFCPVVDLKSTLLDVDRNDAVGRHFANLVSETLIKNFAYVFGSSRDMPTLYKPGHKQSVPFLEQYIYPRYKALSTKNDFQLAPMTQGDLTTPEAFWNANNYLNYYSKVTIPTLLFYSEDDFIVSPKVNSKALRAALEVHPNPFVNVVGVSKGAHCAAAEVYGDDIIDGALETFVLSHAPEFNFSQGDRELDLSTLKDFNKIELAPGEKFFGYEFGAKKGSNSVTMELKIWNPSHNDGNYRCGQWDPFHALESCFRRISLEIPSAHFFPFLDGLPSKEQAQSLTRWLNRRVQVLTKSNNNPVDTTDFPSVAKWTMD